MQQVKGRSALPWGREHWRPFMNDNTRNPDKQQTVESTRLSPARAWDTVKDQLKLEMDRAAYTTWVEDTWFLDYHSNTFSIGIKDDQARDWAASRLTDTAARILLGLMGQEVNIRFITAQPADQSDPQPETSHDPIEMDETMLISVKRGLLEAFTRPDTALYFPGYWLRWVPYIGPKPFATILAFRQALYLAEAEKNGRGDFKENTFFAISAKKVGRIIGLTPKTIRRQRDGYKTSGGKFVPPQLGWFLTVRKTNKVNFSSNTNQFAREAHQYAFKQSPVTPGDIDAIIEWLLEHGLEHEPIKALEAALEAQPREIIQFPMPRPTKIQLKTQPGSARSDLLANILSYCSPQLDTQERKQIITLAEKLRGRILASDGQVKIPLYFLKHILPVIGAPAAILISYLRKRAYRNTATGEVRETVTLDGGIGELAALLGVRPNAVYYHLPINGKKPKTNAPIKDRDLQLGRLIYAINNEQDRLKVSVSTTDILIPEHQEEYDRALTLAEALIQTGTSAEQIERVFDLLSIESNSNQPRTSDSKNVHIQDSNFVHMEDSKNVQVEESNFVPLDDSKSVPIELSENVHMVLSELFKKCPDSKYFNFLSLELLKDIILDLNTNINTLTTSVPLAEKQPSKETVIWTNPVGEEWDFTKLFKSCRIDQETQKALMRNQASAQAFVSHLIYAFSPEGSSLNQPIRFAVKQILRPGDGDLGHGPRHDRLASLGPAGLQHLIRNTSIIEGYDFLVSGDFVGKRDWAQIMGGHINADPLIELGELLGLLGISY
jgi:hypothetical protein